MWVQHICLECVKGATFWRFGYIEAYCGEVWSVNSKKHEQRHEHPILCLEEPVSIALSAVLWTRVSFLIPQMLNAHMLIWSAKLFSKNFHEVWVLIWRSAAASQGIFFKGLRDTSQHKSKSFPSSAALWKQHILLLKHWENI